MADALITTEVLQEWNACEDGMERFVELFPGGADLKTAADALAADGHAEWSVWLFNRCRKDGRYKEQAKNGFRNSGDRNSGDQNSGHQNSGDRNSGHQNSGHQNSGDRNSGDWNSGDRNSGCFNTITPAEILAFNKPCPRAVWDAAPKPALLFALQLTYWVDESQMSDAEKAADPGFYVRGGQLRRRTYKESWRLAWDAASEADRELVKRLPNFDAQVFAEITGIEVV